MIRVDSIEATDRAKPRTLDGSRGGRSRLPPPPAPKRVPQRPAALDRTPLVGRLVLATFYLTIVAVLAVGALNRIELALETHNSQIGNLLGLVLNEAQLTALKQWLATSPLISRHLQQLTPQFGVGYWLGIVGGLLMLSLLLYRSRKRRPALRNVGSTAGWFRWHEVIGILGPTLILFHANFQLHTGNGLRDATSIIAITTMLIVTISGIIARYVYSGREKGMLFALWHYLHLPLFMITILATVVHVIAVHLY